MKIIFESPCSTIEDDETRIEEKIFVFQYDTEEEVEDFEILSHNEQLLKLGFKAEEKTPSTKSGAVNRYFIDPSDSFVVVREVHIIYW